MEDCFLGLLCFLVWLGVMLDVVLIAFHCNRLCDSQGGVEQSNMRFQLEQLFVKGEQERIQKENQEKKEAEQIAAGRFSYMRPEVC